MVYRLFVVVVPLAACGVTGSEFLPPPDRTPLPWEDYPTFVAPAFNEAHDAVGLPDCVGTLLERDYFVLCHDDDWLIARWVGYVITPADLSGTTERTDDFRPDPDLPSGQRAENSDYDEPNFDRGHMAPAGDFTRSRPAMSSTFVLSNMAPQWPELNQGPWRSLESAVRSRISAAQLGWIFTGNLFLDTQGAPSGPTVRIGDNGVAVPTHCFKVLLLQYDDGAVRMAGYVMPNQASGVGLWSTSNESVDDIEALAGLDLFDGLPDDVEDEMEMLERGM